MATLAEILGKKYPNTIWTVRADEYSSLIWYPENTIPKPTEAELRAFDAEVSLEVRWDLVRNRRNKLLTACDWTQLADSPLSVEQKTAWTNYRQLLRNVPQQQVEPENVVWPTQP
jgi:hypothetical protein